MPGSKGARRMTLLDRGASLISSSDADGDMESQIDADRHDPNK
jgi:hypothetical protein